MMNIEEFLKNGYSEEEILALLGKQVPKIQKNIVSSLMEGYLPGQILQFLSKGGYKKNKHSSPIVTGSSPAAQEGQNLAQESSIRQRSQDNVQNRLKATLGEALPLLAGGAGAYALGRALPQAAQKILPLINPSKSAQKVEEAIAQPSGEFPLNLSNPQVADELTQLRNQPPTSEQSLPVQEAQENVPAPIDSREILEKYGLAPKIEDLRKSGNELSGISGYFEKFHPKVVDTIQKETLKPFQEILNDYLQTGISEEKKPEEIQNQTGISQEQEQIPESVNPDMKNEKERTAEEFRSAFDTMKNGVIDRHLYEQLLESLQKGKDKVAGIKDPILQAAKPSFDAGLINSIEDLRKFAKFYYDKKNSKTGISEEKKPEEIQTQTGISQEQEQTPIGSLVQLPDGSFGVVEKVRDGIAAVDVEGKTKHRKLDELQKEPEDVIEAVHNLLKIPEEDRSAPLAWTSYNPTNNKMYVMFHSGKTVEYDDVTEDEFNDITNGKHTPKTEGQNQYGIWTRKDEKSRGASFDIIIKRNPKYAKQNEGKTWRYLREGFDYYEKLRKKPKKRKKTP